MVRLMEEEKTVSASGQIFVPNAFAFSLSRKDFERLHQIHQTLRKELVKVARRAAASERWQMVGPPEAHLVEDPSLKAGTFTVDCEYVEATHPEPAAGPQTKLIQMSLEADAELVLLGRTSRTWPLSKETIVIGRQPDCDVVLSDAGVSRRHAEIRREGDEWVVVDLGSTNGTEINGTRLSRHRLAPGDRLRLGETTLEFRRP